VHRSIRLFRLFLREQSEPGLFYRELAADSVGQVAGFVPLAGRTVLDLGGGPGYFTAAFVARGARCLLVEPDVTALQSGRTPPHGPLTSLTQPSAAANSGSASPVPASPVPASPVPASPPPAGTVRGDGIALPVADRSVDVCFSSNVLEHVRDPIAMLAEMARVTRPGGVIYLAFTNWYSPWGGHEMAPWHYLGAGYAERRYLRVHGKIPKNRPGTGLFPVHVGQMLRAVRARRDVTVLAAEPRYYPRWARTVLLVPGLREVVTWNLLLVLRREPDQAVGTGPVTATIGSSAS
jgi:SAM-dependent methyltransferase